MYIYSKSEVEIAEALQEVQKKQLQSVDPYFVTLGFRV